MISVNYSSSLILTLYFKDLIVRKGKHNNSGIMYTSSLLGYACQSGFQSYSYAKVAQKNRKKLKNNQKRIKIHEERENYNFEFCLFSIIIGLIEHDEPPRTLYARRLQEQILHLSLPDRASPDQHEQPSQVKIRLQRGSQGEDASRVHHCESVR